MKSNQRLEKVEEKEEEEIEAKEREESRKRPDTTGDAAAGSGCDQASIAPLSIRSNPSPSRPGRHHDSSSWQLACNFNGQSY